MTDSTNAKLRELRERVARDEMRVGLVFARLAFHIFGGSGKG